MSIVMGCHNNTCLLLPNTVDSTKCVQMIDFKYLWIKYLFVPKCVYSNMVVMLAMTLSMCAIIASFYISYLDILHFIFVIRNNYFVYVYN